MKKWFACWTLLVLAASSAVAAGPVRLAPGLSPADNPLKGLVPYAHPKPGRFPHSMEFTYLPLSDLMTGPEQFNWKRLDDFLNGVAGRGNQAVFRVWLEYSGAPTGVPRFLIDQGVKIIDWTNRKDDPPTKNHAPDYSDERLVSAMESFIAALGRRYDGDPRIGFITAGLLGAWGEWHDGSRKDLFARRPTQMRVLNAYEKAFSRIPILLRYPAGEHDRWYVPNSSRPFGYHDDSFGWGTLATGNRRDGWFFLTRMSAAGQAAMDKWKTRPIGGEIRPELWGQIFDEKPANPHTQDFAESVRQTHVTWLMDTGMFRELAPPQRRKRAISLVRRMGYDFYVQTAEILPVSDGKVSVSLEVVNQGVAPFYHDWSLELGLLSAEGKVRRAWPVDWKLVGLLPGDPPRRWVSAIDLESLRSGGGVLAVRVINPLPGGKPLRFANADQDRHATGWLSVGSIAPRR